MLCPDEPSEVELTEHQRLSELAAIFALGVIRWHRRLRLAPSSLIPESSEIELDVSRDKSVHAAAPVNTPARNGETA
jgi:hypothetical protein